MAFEHLNYIFKGLVFSIVKSKLLIIIKQTQN